MKVPILREYSRRKQIVISYTKTREGDNSSGIELILKFENLTTVVHYLEQQKLTAQFKLQIAADSQICAMVESLQTNKLIAIIVN